MIPIAVPNLAGNEARYLQECVDSNYVSSVGPFVDRFEEMVAAASGAPHAVATSSGTTGLHVALTALGVQRDDLVILPSLTFIASAATRGPSIPRPSQKRSRGRPYGAAANSYTSGPVGGCRP